MQLAHVHNVKSSKQKPWLKDYMDYFTEKRAGTSEKIERLALKAFK